MPKISYWYVLHVRHCTKPTVSKVWLVGQFQPTACICAKNGKLNGLKKIKTRICHVKFI